MILAQSLLQQLNGNNMNFKILIVCLLLGFTLPSIAQIDKAKKEVIDGKEFYIHKVKKGQTLFGLHRIYDVSVDEIIKHNPEANKGLSIGQQLKIPTGNVVESIQAEPKEIIKDEGDQVKHIVKKGETLYSIARDYGVKGKDLIDVNGEKTLSIGDTVLVPVPNNSGGGITDEVEPEIKNPENQLAEPGDSIVFHKIVAGETLYSLARKYNTTQAKILNINEGIAQGLKIGQEIRIPVKATLKPFVKVDSDTIVDIVEARPLSEVKSKYNIGIYLPFKLDANDAHMAKAPSIGNYNPYFKTIRVVEFYNGVEMAIDSLKNAGLSLDVHVYDTKADTATLNKLLAESEAKNHDLIFGPLTSLNQKRMADFAKENRIRFISPVASSNKLLFKNEYVTKAIPSKPTQIRTMAEFLANKHAHENVILMTDKENKEHSYLVKAFSEVYNQIVLSNPKRKRDSVLHLAKTYKLSSVSPYIVSGDTNILVVPSKDVAYISSFLTDLNRIRNSRGLRKTSYIVYGLEDWLDMGQLDSDYLHNFNLHVVTSRHVNYYSSDVLKFIAKYRAKHNNDPSDYSFIGYDVMMNHLAGMLYFGTGYQYVSNQLDIPTLQMNFNYEPAGEGHGFENKSCYVVGYQDHKIVRKY